MKPAFRKLPRIDRGPKRKKQARKYTCTPAKYKSEIDLGLAVLSEVNRDGEVITLRDIADVCDCSPQRIEQIEKEALRKIAPFLEGLALELGFGS